MNINNKLPRILLVDNDKRVRESYEVLLRYWGYFPVVAVGEGKSLIRDALAKARKARCILAIIDLRLSDDFDEDETNGLELAEEIGPIRSIILSGFQNQKILREMLENHKDIPFLSKADSPEKIKQTLDAEASKVCALKRGLQIFPPDLLESIGQTIFGPLVEEHPDQLADILAQLLPGATKLKIERLDSSLFTPYASVAPTPQSVVLRVYEGDYEPVVVKLAQAHKIEVEVERYEKYISRKIGGNFTARLERYATLWDIGGSLYSYIGDFDVKTFSSYFEEHPIEDIWECLDSFFTVSWGKHYDRRQVYTNVSLFELYREVWGDWYEQRIKNFSAEHLWQSEVIFEKLCLPNPIDWFKSNIAENREHDLSVVEITQKAITHGDLHGDHLLIDSRKNVWVIDFERSGDGHALQDFVELEADIINRLDVHSENMSSYYKMYLVVAGQTQIKELEKGEMEGSDPRIRKTLQTISIIRSLAFKCTGLDDARQYLLGLLFNIIFRATIDNDEIHRARQNRALILASIFCHRLDHWNEPWPPKEWKNLFS
jgi:DNA-binding NarL/FixJ family response regulator